MCGIPYSVRVTVTSYRCLAWAVVPEVAKAGTASVLRDTAARARERRRRMPPSFDACPPYSFRALPAEGDRQVGRWDVVRQPYAVVRLPEAVAVGGHPRGVDAQDDGATVPAADPGGGLDVGREMDV